MNTQNPTQTRLDQLAGRLSTTEHENTVKALNQAYTSQCFLAFGAYTGTLLYAAWKRKEISAFLSRKFPVFVARSPRVASGAAAMGVLAVGQTWASASSGFNSIMAFKDFETRQSITSNSKEFLRELGNQTMSLSRALQYCETGKLPSQGSAGLISRVGDAMADTGLGLFAVVFRTVWADITGGKTVENTGNTPEVRLVPQHYVSENIVNSPAWLKVRNEE